MITTRLTVPPLAARVPTKIRIRHAPQYSPSRPRRTIVIAVRHYAAYGSNLDPDRMRAYCPYSPMVGTGWLEGWRLTFGGEDILGWEGAVTTIVESEGDRVFVAVYDVHPQDEKGLDEVGRHRRCVPEAASAGGAARGRRHRLGLRAQRVRGRAAHGVVPVGAGACRGEGGRAGRLHRRPARPAHPTRYSLSSSTARSSSAWAASTCAASSA